MPFRRKRKILVMHRLWFRLLFQLDLSTIVTLFFSKNINMTLRLTNLVIKIQSMNLAKAEAALFFILGPAYFFFFLRPLTF